MLWLDSSEMRVFAVEEKVRFTNDLYRTAACQSHVQYNVEHFSEKQGCAERFSTEV